MASGCWREVPPADFTWHQPDQKLLRVPGETAVGPGCGFDSSVGWLQSQPSSSWVWGHYRRAPCTLPGWDPAVLHCWGEHHLESHRSLESENSRGEGMFLKGWNKRLALMLLQPAWKTRSKWKPWSLDRGIIILDLEESSRIFHRLLAVLVRWSR